MKEDFHDKNKNSFHDKTKERKEKGTDRWYEKKEKEVNFARTDTTGSRASSTHVLLS